MSILSINCKKTIYDDFLIILVMEPEEEEISLTLKRDTGQKWGFAFTGKVKDYFKRYFIDFSHSSLSI